MKKRSVIVRTSGTCRGMERVRGTHATVAEILRRFCAGAEPRDIAAAYSRLTLLQVHEVLRHALRNPRPTSRREWPIVDQAAKVAAINRARRSAHAAGRALSVALAR